MFIIVVLAVVFIVISIISSDSDLNQTENNQPINNLHSADNEKIDDNTQLIHYNKVYSSKDIGKFLN